jgi:hypothetical protein
MYWKTCGEGPGKRENLAHRSVGHIPYAVMDFLSSLVPEGGGKHMLGGELRHEDQRESRTGVWVDRVGTVDVMGEENFRILRHDRSRTKAETRYARVNQRGLINALATARACRAS